MLSASMEGNDRMIGLIETCSDADFPQIFDMVVEKCETKISKESKKTKTVNTKLTFILLATACFINTYIRNCLTQGKPQKIKLVFENILLFLKHPLLSEKRMLSLLFMIKQYILKVKTK